MFFSNFNIFSHKLFQFISTIALSKFQLHITNKIFAEQKFHTRIKKKNWLTGSRTLNWCGKMTMSHSGRSREFVEEPGPPLPTFWALNQMCAAIVLLAARTLPGSGFPHFLGFPPLVLLSRLERNGRVFGSLFQNTGEENATKKIQF